MSVSIVIPTYNRAALVCDAIASALAERGHGAKEVIVVDDGSTDDTQESVARHSDRIAYVRTPNQGVSMARNVGLSLATGSYVRFLDSDDLIVAGSTQFMLQAFEKGEADAVIATRVDRGGHDYPISQIVDGNSERGNWLKPEHILRRGIQLGSVMFRKEHLVALDGFDPQGICVQDYDLMFRGLAAGWRIFFVPKPACHVRSFAGERLSRNRSASDYIYFGEMGRRVADRMAALFQQDKAACQAFAQLIWYTARAAARDGYRAQSLELFELATTIGGPAAETGHPLVRSLYRLVDPFSAELVAMKAKTVFGRLGLAKLE